MTVYRRLLVKAALAGLLLCCLSFVPSAKPNPHSQAPSSDANRGSAQVAEVGWAG